MPKKKTEVNKVEEIRKILASNPKIPAKEVLSTLADKGITVAASLVYFVKGKVMSESRKKPIDREALLTELRELLPSPVREESEPHGSIVMEAGEPGEVIVRVNGDKVSFSVFSVRWDGPHTPVVYPEQVATLNWDRVPASSISITLRTLVRAVCDARKATFRQCEHCGKNNPPEWMHDNKTCQACASQHLSVVY
jgi:hypothetical protein